MDQETDENMIGSKPEMDGKVLQEDNGVVKPILSEVESDGEHDDETEKIEVIEEKPQLKKLPSQEAKEFMAKYGTLKKENSLLIKKKGKRFDSADYFQAVARVSKK